MSRGVDAELTALAWPPPQTGHLLGEVNLVAAKGQPRDYVIEPQAFGGGRSSMDPNPTAATGSQRPRYKQARPCGGPNIPPKETYPSNARADNRNKRRTLERLPRWPNRLSDHLKTLEAIVSIHRKSSPVRR